MKKHIKKWAHIIWRIFETLIAFVLVALSLLFYSLHDSQMDAGFLIPEIEKQILPKESDYHIKAENIILGSDFKKEGLIQIEIEDLAIVRPDGTEAISVPQARLAYDFWHLITFNYVPSTVILKQPDVDLFLADSGKMIVQNDDSEAVVSEDKVKQIIRQLLAFRHVRVEGATLRFQDKQTQESFTFSHFNLNLANRFRIHEKINFDSDLSYAGQNTRLLLEGSLNRMTKHMELQIGFPSVYLKPLGRFLPLLSGMDFPVQLSVKAQLDLPKRKKSVADVVEKINFQVKSVESGTLNLPEPLTNDYPVKELQINGLLTQSCQLLKIDQSQLVLNTGTTADLYAEITGLKEFIQTGDLKHIKTDFKSKVLNIKTEDIGKVWPRGIGTSTHDWVATHLTKGTIPQADFTLNFVGDELVDLYGDVQAQGVQVNYLPPMPPVQNVKAQVELFPDTVKIHVFNGHTDSLNIQGSELLFTDVDIDPSWANVHLKITGSVSDAFHLLSYKPLEFTQEYGIDWAHSKGQASLDTELFFKLDTESEPDEVKVKTQADIKNAKIVLGEPQIVLDQASLSLNLTNQKMQVEGKSEIFEMPLSLKWTEYFVPENGLRSIYDLQGKFSTTYLKDLYPDIEKFIMGTIGLKADFKKFEKEGTFSGNLAIDAGGSQVQLYPLGLIKKMGQGLIFKASLSQPTPQDFKIDMDMFGKAGDPEEDLNLQGRMHLGKEMLIDFPKIQALGTQLGMTYQKTDKDLKIEINGEKWNASKILQMPMDFLPDTVSDNLVRNLLFNVHLNQVSFDEKNPIKNLVIEANRHGKNWASFHSQADLKEPFIFIFDAEKKQFQGAYKDFGNLMASLGFKTNIADGSLTLQADEKENGDIQGKILIQKLTFKEPGFLTQALTILGILDAFMGKDIVFDKVDIPFIFDLNNNLQIQDGVASGTNLGITFKGTIEDNELNLKGSLVPAYAINSLPGKIPFVGWVFKNTEGGGLINLPFIIQGTLGKPVVELKPMGTVKPGFLGNIFE